MSIFHRPVNNNSRTRKLLCCHVYSTHFRSSLSSYSFELETYDTKTCKRRVGELVERRLVQCQAGLETDQFVLATYNRPILSGRIDSSRMHDWRSFFLYTQWTDGLLHTSLYSLSLPILNHLWHDVWLVTALRVCFMVPRPIGSFC